MNSSISAAVMGAAGYTGGELLRLLLNHPAIHHIQAVSASQAGKAIYEVHTDLFGDTKLRFQAELEGPSVDVLFLCSGHGTAIAALEKFELLPHTRIIDLGNDFRLSADAQWRDRTFVYGLPEHHKASISSAVNIANPGCFATAIQLALLPLQNKALLKGPIHVQGTTGSTGAGQKPSETTHFSWRQNNLGTYKTLKHQHLAEINEQLGLENQQIWFVPQRGAFARGILVSAAVNYSGSLDEIKSLYQEYYASSPFVHLSDDPIHLKQVVNTNKCLIHLMLDEGRLVVVSVIDNLLKGASGQAVQNMNLMFNLPENTGLKLKPLGY